MHTSSRSPSQGRLGRYGLVLPLALVASAVLAVDPDDPPPGAPAYAADNPADPNAGAFRYNSAAKTAVIQFGTVTDASGYRLYLGSAPRAAGSPYSVGNTPCDLAAATDPNPALRRASLETCLTNPANIATQNLHLAVTAYNTYGNEGNYSTNAFFIPVTPPTGVTTAAGGGNEGAAQTVTLQWTRGTAPAGATLETEIFRRELDGDGNPVGGYTKLTVASNATSLTDSNGLKKTTEYEYTLRSVGIPGATAPGSPSTYSTLVVVKRVTLPTVYDGPAGNGFVIAGNRGSGNPVVVTSLAADEIADVDDVGGNVIFAPSGCSAPCVCSANANGISQGTYDDQLNQINCYSQDYCNPDPVEGTNHAALMVKVGSGPNTPVGTDGGTFTGTGNLAFFVNDCSASNNQQSFTAIITISRIP